MSWDADLYGSIDGHRVHLGEWSYTHNCNRMANAVLTGCELRDGARRWWSSLDRLDVVSKVDAGTVTGSWWECLHGRTGQAGADLLTRIVNGLTADPARFRAMDPPNGYGDYHSFLQVLRDMRDMSVRFPSGCWETSG